MAASGPLKPDHHGATEGTEGTEGTGTTWSHSILPQNRIAEARVLFSVAVSVPSVVSVAPW